MNYDETFFTELLQQHQCQEILLRGTNSAWAYKDGKHWSIANPFSYLATEEHTYNLQDMALEQGIVINPSFPSGGGSFAEGAIRWHCVIPPVVQPGPILNLRKHHFSDIDIHNFAITKQQQNLLNTLFERKSPMLICGPSGCGKTSLLHALIKEKVNHMGRMILIEEFSELPLPHPNSIKFIVQRHSPSNPNGYSIHDGFREALRLRPDFTIFGELRGHEINSFFETIAAGHHGLISTFHCSNRNEFLYRCSTQITQFNSYLKKMDLWLIFIENDRKRTLKSIEKFGSEL